MEFPRTVEEIFKDYKGRRSGILMALTEEADDFYQKCDPERENLALYAEPDGTWVLDLPAEEVPAELPEPMLGINFAREGMTRKDFLSLVAVQSDAWLMAVAFYFASKLNGTGRMQLFNRINELQPLFEIMQGKPKMKVKPTPAGGKKRKQSDIDVPPAAQEELVIDPGWAPVPPPELTSTSNEVPSATGRLLAYSDIAQALKGRQAELFWPDDNLWYLVKIFSVNVRNRIAKIVYDDLSVEELDLNEIVKEGHMSLLTQ